MAIKLSPANVDHLLQIANRLSKNAHTFSVTAEILEIAQRAEDHLSALGIPSAKRKGATVVALSGEPVSNSYKFSRKGTLVTLERAATVWKFRSAHSGAVYKEGGYERLHLTAEQDALAVANLRKSYMVL